MSDETKNTAHQILLDHVTNVSAVTAKVIRAAVDEYEALIVDRPSTERMIEPQFNAMLAEMDQALEIFERAVRGMRVHVRQMTLQLNPQLQREPIESNGNAA